jgi:hypothetical protein
MPYTPICIAKAVKNSAESDGMRRAHVSRVAGVGDRVGVVRRTPCSPPLWPWAYVLRFSRVSGSMK